MKYAKIVREEVAKFQEECYPNAARITRDVRNYADHYGENLHIEVVLSYLNNIAANALLLKKRIEERL
jgi:hypothetical protein